MTKTDIDFEAPAPAIGAAWVMCHAKAGVIVWNPAAERGAGNGAADRATGKRLNGLAARSMAGSGTS